MSDFDRLSRNQRRAIMALLESRTIKKAAETLGLSERTLRRYLNDDTFRNALGQAESAAIHNAARRLIQGSDLALNVLELLMVNAKSESVRRTAASDWIANVLKWQELAVMAARVAEIEEQIYGSGGPERAAKEDRVGVAEAAAVRTDYREPGGRPA